MQPNYVLVEEEPEPKQTKQKIAGALIALAVLGSVWIAKDRLSAAVSMSPSCVQLTDQRSETDAGLTRIYGTVTNACQKEDFGTVIVYFRLSDTQGKVVGQTQATRRNLAPGDRWDFATTGFFTPPSFELERILAY